MASSILIGNFSKPLVSVLKEFGCSPSELIENTDFPADVITRQDALIPLSTAIELVEHAAINTQCGHIGLLIGERVGIDGLGLLGLLFKSAPTLGGGILELIRHLGVSATGLRRELHVEGGVVFISSSYDDQKVDQSSQAHQMSVAIAWQLIQQFTANTWHPISVSFTFKKPKDSAFYRQFFKIPVIFSADYSGVAFHEADLDIRPSAFDLNLHNEMKTQIELIETSINDNFVSDVKRIVRRNLELGFCSIEAVVKFFPLEKRGFQYKLEKHGTSYQKILDEIRFQKAELHLKKSAINLSQLADLLCYKDASVFSTAFKNKYGLPPSEWRNENIETSD